MGYSNTDKIFRSVRNLVNYENQKGCQKEQDRVVESFLYISEMKMYTDDLVHEYEIYSRDNNLPIRSNDEYIFIYGQIFAIAASHIESNRARRQILKETFHYRPWLVIDNC